MSTDHYPFAEVEPRWQAYWLEHDTFRAEDISERPPFYVLDMFPYPSAAGLHVGHPEGYTATDIMARYKRMCGFNVLHPMGWDAFGLPAEQHALQTGVHPAITTARNIDTFRAQIRRLGLGYDWGREVNTTDPAYYKWTQWIFLKLFENGLAYEAEVPVNWCPELGTVLANEEVTAEGRSERGNFPVVRKPMRQWLLRITAYAERLLADLEALDWPESIKAMQRHWIGRSEGAEVRFAVAGGAPASAVVEVYTTRPDTLYGATYMVLAPEHPLVSRITTDAQRAEVDAYVRAASMKSDLDRTDLAKEKTGVFVGAHAINPVNGQEIPIWIADYVLGHYGTGAIMAVPAHDERDYAFARQFELPIVAVVAMPDGSAPDLSEAAWTGEGRAMASGPYDGMTTAEFKAAITAKLEADGVGKASVNFRLRDWLFSRQRYWGEPIPLIHCEDGTIKAIPESELPLLLPEVESYKPAGTGESPLAHATDWIQTTDPETGKPARRETNTMPQWAGSCWYYLRYIDPHNTERLVDPEKERYWMPVELYVGGAEHAVLHLLYARFWHKFLFDIGVVSTPEPFMKLVNQGMILGSDGQKMSKSMGNVVNPDEIVERFGADAMRMYEMFMGPLEAVKPWATKDIVGISRFLDRVWKVAQRPLCAGEGDEDLRRLVHRSIRKVSEDIEGMRFNTAIAQLMVLTNELMKQPEIPRSALEALVLCLHPFAPHIAEEIWRALGHDASVAHAQWPGFDPALCEDDEVEVVIQVNGKVRGRFMAAKDAASDDLKARALADEVLQRWTEGKTVRKVIVVPGKLVNVVVS